MCDFENQNQAYHYFITHVGLDRYQSIIEAELRRTISPVVLVGFSVGTSALWGLSDQPCSKHVQKVFGFYGSQIRHCPDISPLPEIKLIFPEKEPHFDVNTLIRQLESKPNITCTKSKGLHGFMNKISEEFNPECYRQHMNELKYSLQLLADKK